jgi:hypothetical protein
MHDLVMDTLKECRYSVLSESEDLERVFRLRYDCYRAENAIERNDSGIMRDSYDESANCVHVAVEFEDKFVAAVRLHLVSNEVLHAPSIEVFPDVAKILEPGEIMLDPTRFVVHPQARLLGFPLHLVALRIPFLAAMFYDVDTVLAAVRKEHSAFYIRYLGYQYFATPRPYLGLIKPLGLMTARFKEKQEKVLEKYPFFGPVDSIPQSDIDFPKLPEVCPSCEKSVARVA